MSRACNKLYLNFRIFVVHSGLVIQHDLKIKQHFVLQWNQGNVTFCTKEFTWSVLHIYLISDQSKI